MAEVALQGVTKNFGRVAVCRGIDLRIPDGEFVTLLGPSGCGKTTTLNIVAGLEDATSGDILIGGQRVNDLTPHERDVAMVFQNYALYPHMTVAENIGFTLRLRRRQSGEIRRRVAAVAESLELGHVLDRVPAQLSGGQQQRVALGRAIVREPRVYLFDEPFSNLDAGLRLRMRAEIKELHQRLGVTSIFVTHDQEEALSLSDRIAIMRDGRLEQVGTPEDVYARPTSKYVARFIGSPAVEFLGGTFDPSSGVPTFRVDGATFEVSAPMAPLLAGRSNIEVAIRPEHVVVADDGIAATIRLVQPVGASTFLTLALDSALLTARVPGMARFRAGDKLHFRVDPANLLFFDRDSGFRLAAAA